MASAYVSTATKAVAPPRVTGRVKWFNSTKGYGFITGEREGDDIFLHFSALNMDGFKSCREGDEVLYTPMPNGEKGLAAQDVDILLRK